MVITGASSGIGAAVAIEAATMGMDLFLTGRNATALKAVADQARAKGSSKVSFGIGDVGDEKSVEALVKQAVADLGTIDVFVGCAGIGRRGSVDGVVIDDFDLSFRTNVRGPFLWLHFVLPVMKRAHCGQIVMISSLMGTMTAPNAALYCGCKFALEGMLGCVRKDVAGTGIKVALIAPGATDTAWWDDPLRGGNSNSNSKPSVYDKGRMLSARDVAVAVLAVVKQSHTSDIERVVLQPPA